MKDKRRDQREYRRRARALRAEAKRRGLVCWLCHEPFDFTLDYRDPMAFTADHVLPIAKGGHILGPLRPAHRKCNSRRNDGRNEERIPTTRDW